MTRVTYLLMPSVLKEESEWIASNILTQVGTQIPLAHQAQGTRRWNIAGLPRPLANLEDTSVRDSKLA